MRPNGWAVFLSSPKTREDAAHARQQHRWRTVRYSWTATVIFTIDIILNFQTGFHYHGAIVTQRRLIVFYYARAAFSEVKALYSYLLHSFTTYAYTSVLCVVVIKERQSRGRFLISSCTLCVCVLVSAEFECRLRIAR